MSLNNCTNATIQQNHSKPEDIVGFVPEIENVHLRSALAFGCALIFIVGVPGNIVLLAALRESIRSRDGDTVTSVTSVLIFNITASDLVLLLYVIPLFTLHFVLCSWTFGPLVCTAFKVASHVTMSVSFYSMVCLSVVRYVAVVHPIRARLVRYNHALLLCAFIWLATSGLSTPRWLYSRVVGVGARNVCALVMDERERLLFDVALNIVGFIPAVAVMVFCYSRIVRTLWRRGDMIRNNQASVLFNRQATIMTLVAFIAFCLLCIPMLVYMLCQAKLFTNSLDYAIVSQVSIVLCYTNSCINPVIYFSLSGQFRLALKKVLRNCHSEQNLQNNGLSRNTAEMHNVCILTSFRTIENA
ncbi:galanin receptor 2a-like [Lampetra fluviatilis]